jgi:hypothetical protein
MTDHAGGTLQRVRGPENSLEQFGVITFVFEAHKALIEGLEMLVCFGQIYLEFVFSEVKR